jgi:hypothetical protein
LALSFPFKKFSSKNQNYSRDAVAFVGTIDGTKYPTSKATKAPTKPVIAHVKNPLPLVGFMSIENIFLSREFETKKNQYP